MIDKTKTAITAKKIKKWENKSQKLKYLKISKKSLKMSSKASVRVLRAETRLTVYRSPYLVIWEMNKKNRKIKNISKQTVTVFCACPPSGNQVDGSPPALVCKILGFEETWSEVTRFIRLTSNILVRSVRLWALVVNQMVIRCWYGLWNDTLDHFFQYF